MGRIINSPMPWKYPVPVRALDDDDEFVFWDDLNPEAYKKLLERFKKENGYTGEASCPTSTNPSANKSTHS